MLCKVMSHKGWEKDVRSEPTFPRLLHAWASALPANGSLSLALLLPPFVLSQLTAAHRDAATMMSDSGALDHRAQRGFAKSAAYDQHRPAYPDKIVQLLLEKLGLDGKTGAQVLDLAAGTGKFTTLLAQRPEQYDVTAVEPHNDMRRILEEKKLHGVVVKEGRADSIPLDDESVDAVICAQVGLPFTLRDIVFFRI